MFVSTLYTMAGVASAIKPHFWRNPIRYCRWAAHEKPALYYSVLIGVAGPLMLVTVLPIRKAYGWKPRPEIPMTYPGELEGVVLEPAGRERLLIRWCSA